MISIFMEAAVRSLLVGLAVGMALRLFRVRNLPAQKAAWGLVLASAVAMPLLLPVTAKWPVLPASVSVVVPAHPMTLLEELQARLVARGGPGSRVAPPAAPARQGDQPNHQESSAPEHASAPGAIESPSGSAGTHHHAGREQDGASIPKSSASSLSQSPTPSAGFIHKAQSPPPIRHIAVSPEKLLLTLYCGIAGFLLVRLALGLFTTIRLWHTAAPVSADHLPDNANSVPLRASSNVSSPVTIGSAILLPANHTSWDHEKLRIVLAHERSHIRQGDFYMQLLASVYAALAWFSPLGWWLKRELADLAEAISDRAGLQEAQSSASYAQILLEFAAAPRRVSLGVAMARPCSLSRRIERLLNDNLFRQCFAGGRVAFLVAALVPLALFASTALVRVEAATGQQPPTAARSFASTAAKEPAFQIAPQLNTAQAKSSAATELIAAASPAPETGVTPFAAEAEGVMQAGGGLEFDRTLSVSGTAQLSVSTGSGNIHITRGSGNQIQIHGRIHVNREGSEEQARQIAANPPIEQNGNAIRIGQHQEQWHGISIDYEIEAPAGAELAAISGSGDIVDEGVGQNAKLETGSGDISATSLEGPFTVKTGSGNITAGQTGQGDVIAETGSGDIDLKDIHGSFRGQTGSGDIKASGSPSAPWTLQTGSGNIELWTGNAPLTLDASTGSGSVSTQPAMMVQGTFDHHHIHGDLNGGGPLVRAQTGSGDVHIH